VPEPLADQDAVVLVVGAGPTGLVVAALLAEQGIASLVVERRADVYPLPRAVHLDDETMRILQRVGVVDRFLPLTRPALGMRLVDGGLRTMVQFDRSRPLGVHGYPQANLFDQPDLERLLRERVAELDLVELRTGLELVGLAGTTATVRDVATGASSVIRSQVVLGGDGANSTVRQLLDIAWRDLGFRERWLVVDVLCPESLGTWEGVHQVCDPVRAATYLQVGDHRYRWEFRLLDGESPADLSLPALLGPWVGDRDVEIVRAVEYTFHARVAERWGTGRVLLLGDAAHQTPPFIGQGLGDGLRDAANLAWKLAAVLRGADERLLATYEAERAPHAVALIRLARTVGWALTGGQGRAAVVRRTALAALCRMPALTRRVLDRGTPPLRSGALVARRRHPRDLAGSLVPQPDRLDDLLGTGFCVLTAVPMSDELTSLARSLDAKVLPVPPSLVEWLRRGRAQAVLVRPDRVVMATVDRRSRLHAPLDVTRR
jgi:3-(3-hydroxy-phenyl)propionate hydroxylase